MTLSYSTRYVKYSPAVLTAVFLVPFPIFSINDLRVVVDGTETALWSASGTFVGGRALDAQVTLTLAVTGVDVEIYGRRLPRRDANYLQSAPDLAGNMQADADILTAVQQEQSRDYDRAVKVASGKAPVLSQITPGTTLAFDAAGDEIISGPTVDQIAGASAAASAASSSASAAAASAAAAAAAQNTILKPKGQWLTATAYVLGDLVYQLGSQYECITAHTSGTFATDLSAAKWRIFVAQGAPGAGTGDVLQVNAGSEYSGVAGTFRNNISAFGAAITAQTATDVLSLAASNPRGFAFYAGASLTNAPSGYTTGDVFFTKGTDSNNVTILWLRTDGQIFMNVQVAGTWSGWVQQATQAALTAAIAAAQQILHVRDEKPSGTSGGTFTAGSYLTRTLNTVKTNSIPGASLAANRITLPVGTYEVDALAQAHRVFDHKAVLFNVTDAATVVAGFSSYADGTNGGSTPSSVRGRFTIAGQKVFELRHRCSSTYATIGLGRPSSFGDIEVYADVLIRKIS